MIDAPLPDTQRSRDVKSLISNGTLTGISLEFIAHREEQVGGVRRITKAAMVRAAVVDSPSYKGSTVEARGKAKRRRVWL